MQPLDVVDWLGGGRHIRRSVHSELEWVQVVEEGLPTGVVDDVLGREKLTPAELYQLVIPRRTLSHRRANQERLTREESDRLARVARVMTFAEETFQHEAKAHTWLRRPNRALGGRTPIALLETEQGARVVEDVLGRIAHGVFS